MSEMYNIITTKLRPGKQAKLAIEKLQRQTDDVLKQVQAKKDGRLSPATETIGVLAETIQAMTQGIYENQSVRMQRVRQLMRLLAELQNQTARLLEE